ncbi:MAG: thermonuclease family protein [Nitrososphaera sp.]|nr:thermonuclease family protein [Nitrososphaera sp.]
MLKAIKFYLIGALFGGPIGVLTPIGAIAGGVLGATFGGFFKRDVSSCLEESCDTKIISNKAQVVSIIDGDTIGIFYQGKEQRVRLADIDAPEKSQVFGMKSKQSLSSLVYHKTVRVEEHGTDRYGRTLARVFAVRLDVCAEQVRRGMAWVYRKYSKDSGLIALEDKARSTRIGLWADVSPIPPWKYRKRQKLYF